MNFFRVFFENVRGVINGLVLILNTVFWGIPLMLLAVLKLLFKNEKWQLFWTTPIVWLAVRWADVVIFIEHWLVRNNFDIQQEGETLSMDNSYLVLSNHQSMADVPVLQKTLHGRIPFMRYFAKAELKKLPIFGFAWQAVDCPFMHRYSKEFIQKNPHLKGKDLLETIECCRRLRHGPAAITNYVEGTRFSPAKHTKYASPYQHLLPPRAGGIALAIAAFEGQLKTVIDVTICYHQPKNELWDFLCGRIKKITVHVNSFPLPAHFHLHDYQNDQAFKVEFQDWLNNIWQKKDDRLTKLLVKPAL